MKTIKYIVPILLFSLSLLFMTCDEREFDEPGMKVPQYNGQATMTIEEFKAWAKQKLETAKTNVLEITPEDNVVLAGVVVANDISGNIYKQIQVQDETAGINIAIDRNNIYTTYRVGQPVFIECSGLYVGYYSGYMQLGTIYRKTTDSNPQVGQMSWLDVTEKIRKDSLPTALSLPLDTIRIDEIGETHVGKLVTLRNVYFNDGGKAVFAEKGYDGAIQTVSHMLTSAVTASDTPTIESRNSSASNFANRTLPVGVGMVTGVISLYQTSSNKSYQITFREYSDCSQENFTDEGRGTKDSPWSIEYALANQTSGQTGWIEGYIVGTVKSGVTKIESNDDIDFEAPFEMDNTVVLAASPDVRDWQQSIVVNIPSSDMRTLVNLEDNPGNLGKKLKVEGSLEKVLETASGLVVSTGTTSEFELEGLVVDEGDGSAENPYSVAQAIQNQGASEMKWVKGYIIGAVKNGVTSVTGSGDIELVAPFGSATNVLLADSKTETDYTKCVAVNLPAGKNIRTQVNLSSNSGNLHKELTVKGALKAYFGLAGSRDNEGDDFVLEGGSVPGTAILDVPFSGGNIGGFTPVSVKGAQVWKMDTQYSNVNMSGFVSGANVENEDWLISPVFSLAGATAANLAYDYTISKGAGNTVTQDYMKTHQTVWITTNYTGDPLTTTWTQLHYTTFPAGTNWVYVTSTIALPAGVMGQANVRIAFKYICDTEDSATWQIRNLKVTK